MSALARLIYAALAFIGVLALVVVLHGMLQQHYATKCVDDDADNYGFSFHLNNAGLRRAPELYGGHYAR